MIGAAASLLIVLVLALILGQALAALAAGAGRERPLPPTPLAPAYGIAAMLLVAGIAIRLPGHATTAAIALALAAVAAAVYLRGRVGSGREAVATGLPVVAITTVAASLPFAIAGFVGILGVGLVNDDMASHLIIADYVSDYAGTVPSFIKGGYPIGPHAVVAAISRVTGTGLVDVFAGFTVALAPLLGLLAIGLLGRMPRGRLIAGAALVALPYLGAAYLTQGAFKEPLQAMLLIAFALALAALVGVRSPLTERTVEAGARDVHPLLRVLPLAVLAAASVFNYSLPGLLWIGAVGAVVLLVRWFIVQPRPTLPADWLRRLAPYLLGLIVVVAIATAGEWSRIADFSRLSALNPDRFGSDLGNLAQALSPLEALGIWPAGEFDATPSSAGAPAALFYLGALIGLAALTLGLLRDRREGSWTLPALLVAMAAVYVLAALFSSPYISAKALAIVAPVAMAIALRGTLARHGPALALGVVLVVLAAGSSFLVIRNAPVGPDSHSRQLESMRALVAGEPVLFLGRDDFIGWELRGSGPITGIVTNFYDVEDARPRFKKGEGGGEKFDVDAVFPATLDSFRYVLATTGGPASGVPPRFRELARTNDYVLYENTGRTGRRHTLDEGTAPGAVLDCTDPAQRPIAKGKGTALVWNEPPVIAEPDGWEPDPTASDGAPATMRIEIPAAGRWLISLEYDSRRPLRVRSTELGIDTTMAANLDFRGETPTFPVATVDVERPTTAALTVEPEAPNVIARLLRAPNDAHLRSLTATPVGPGAVERIPVRQTCGHYVDWYRER
ncbi:MAG TPA: hypothetical protein VFH44_09560 [Solirubrobacterales bacterium]|nr:hypothetical protein [Solirubrobacterales bacterium]